MDKETNFKSKLKLCLTEMENSLISLDWDLIDHCITYVFFMIENDKELIQELATNEQFRDFIDDFFNNSNIFSSDKKEMKTVINVLELLI